MVAVPEGCGNIYDMENKTTTIQASVLTGSSNAMITEATIEKEKMHRLQKKPDPAPRKYRFENKFI